MTPVLTRNLLLRLVFCPIAALGTLTSCSGPGSLADSSSQSVRQSVPQSAAQAVPVRTDLTPIGDVVGGVPVERVIDGDTIKVLLRGQDITVRLIGLDTPETVKPGSPVECFGPEASDFAKQMLNGQTVTLESDASQGVTDRYGRVLAYVWLELPGDALSLFNLEVVAGGYGIERQYGPLPYVWREEFAAAQASAQRDDLGMWGACA